MNREEHIAYWCETAAKDFITEPHPFLTAAFTPLSSFVNEIINTGIKIL